MKDLADEINEFYLANTQRSNCSSSVMELQRALADCVKVMQDQQVSNWSAVCNKNTWRKTIQNAMKLLSG